MMTESGHTVQCYTEKSPLLDDTQCMNERTDTFFDDKHYTTIRRPRNTDVEIEAGLRGTDKRVLVFCFLMNVLFGCTISTLPPFYPLEAGSRQIPVLVTGFVLCVFEVVYFITELLFKRILFRFRVKVIYIASLIFASVSCLMFSTIHLLNPRMQWQFVLTSVLCRFGQAVGTSGLSVSSTFIVSELFPSQEICASALRKVGMGTTLGYVAGPIIGGYLYSIGGFGLPFYVLATLTFITGFLFNLSAPSSHNTHHSRIRTRKDILHKTSMIHNLLSNPTIPFSIVSIFVCAVSIACLDPILSNNVTGKYGISTSLVGMLFAIPPVVSVILMPLWGCLIQDETIRTTCHLLGHTFIGVGFVFLGPSPLLSLIPAQFWTTITGLILIGAGTGCVLLTATTLLVEGAPEDGQSVGNTDVVSHRDYAAVNRIVDVSYFVGVALGPILGSFLVECFEFRVTSTVIACFSLMIIVFYIIALILSWLGRKCGWIFRGRRHKEEDDDKDCERCVIRKRDETFGVLPPQLQTSDITHYRT